MNAVSWLAVPYSRKRGVWRRVFKSSRNDGASEDPRLEEHGKKYKHSFYRMLGDVSKGAQSSLHCI